MTLVEGPWTHGYAETNGIRMHYVEQGAGPPVLLLHGFPEFWYSWRHQIPALAAAGFRAVAPDLRGYGETDKPEGVEAYDIYHLVGDLTGLLDALGLPRAVVAGHDWGGIIAWQMALLQPERVEAVIGMNTPFQGRGPVRPTEQFRQAPDGRFNYILRFQDPAAPAQLEADLEGNLREMMRRGAKYADFLSPEELGVYVEAFRKGGLTGPINYYRNVDRNWETTAHLDGRQVECPALMILAEDDPILKPSMADGMGKHVPDLRKILIRDCGHWTQQERPGEVSRVMIDFLSGLGR